jgi:hypothetical protein
VYEAKKIKIKIRDSLYSGVDVLRAQKKVENRRDWNTAGKHLRWEVTYEETIRAGRTLDYERERETSY